MTLQASQRISPGVSKTPRDFGFSETISIQTVENVLIIRCGTNATTNSLFFDDEV
jgi:hypothetical protein